MELEGCEALREILGRCGLVLITATALEAEPVITEMVEVERHTVAGKELYLGRLSATGGAAGDKGSAGWVRSVLAISGCDKANAAHMLTLLFQAMKPKPWLVLQLGVAGAFPRAGLGAGARVGDVVLATEEIYSDTGSSSPEGWLSARELGLPLARVRGRETGGRFRLDARLVRVAAEAVKGARWGETRPQVVTGPCVTASCVTGLSVEGEKVARRWGAVAESMEGAAAAHICALYDVPFLEVRGVSNMVIDRNRASWQVEQAVSVAAQAALAVVATADRLPLTACGIAARARDAPSGDEEGT